MPYDLQYDLQHPMIESMFPSFKLNKGPNTVHAAS